MSKPAWITVLVEAPTLVLSADRLYCPPGATEFLVHPQPDHFMWGPHGAKVQVTDPAGALAGCRDRGVTVALSSWFNTDDE